MGKVMEYYILIVLVMSFITACTYALDKAKAKRNKWRIKEVVLLSMSLLFGSIGGIFSLYVLRHKNKHWYFVLINFLALIIHILVGYYVYKFIGFVL